MDPINYSIDVQTPFQAALQGYQSGAAIRNDLQQQDAMRQAQEQARQQQLQLQQAQQQAWQSPTADNFSKLILIDPKNREAYQKAWENLDTSQQRAHTSDVLKWGSAIKTGQPDIAAEAMNQRADAMENTAGGPTPQSKALRVQAQLAKQNPEFVLGQFDAMLATSPLGKEASDTLKSIKAEARADALAPAEQQKADAESRIKQAEAAAAPETVALKNAQTRAEISDKSARLGLDKDKLQSEVELKLYELKSKQGELPEYAVKEMNTAATEAISASQSAQKMEALANDIEKEGGGYGAFSTAGEWIKAKTGNQNEMTRLRSEYSRMVTPAAMGAYKQVASGSTSDRDIDTAMKGVPSDTADAATMAAYLRGVAKLQRYDSILSNAKAEWLGEVKNLGKAKQDVEIDGVKVAAGTTFKVFTDQYLKRKVVQTRGYMTKYATPAPASDLTRPPAPAMPMPGDGGD